MTFTTSLLFQIMKNVARILLLICFGFSFSCVTTKSRNFQKRKHLNLPRKQLLQPIDKDTAQFTEANDRRMDSIAAATGDSIITWSGTVYHGHVIKECFDRSYLIYEEADSEAIRHRIRTADIDTIIFDNFVYVDDGLRELDEEKMIEKDARN